jgi:hypothetical protein
MGPKDVHPDDETAEERRIRKALRKAKKMAKHLERLGLDENGNELDASYDKYPVRTWNFTVPGLHDKVAINPAVTMIGVVCLWSLVVWCHGKFNRRNVVGPLQTNCTHTFLQWIPPTHWKNSMHGA